MMPTPIRMTQAMSWPVVGDSPKSPFVIGVLEGEGIGPEIIRACLLMIETIEQCTDHRFEIRYGGPIGLLALKESGAVLTTEVIDFCSSIFSSRGAVFCGPGGGRFVYDLRKQFNMYCKLAPIQPLASLKDVGVLKRSSTNAVDIVVVRENMGGLYQGTYGTEDTLGGLQAHHSFSYDENQVMQILKVAIHLAKQRAKKLCVITKPGGLPTISALWKQCAELLTAGEAIDCCFLEVDNAAYQIIADAKNFDVIVAPNLFGDIIADCAALLLGSRGLSYSANFGPNGIAVYQTGHGAAYDLAGKNTANPLGQLSSLIMMLHESFGLSDISIHLKAAMDFVLAKGFRTRDIMEPDCKEVGTMAIAEQIAANLRVRLSPHTSVEPVKKTPRAALLLIDAQNDFIARLGSAAMKKKLVSRMASLLSFCREQKIPVLHIQTQVSSDGLNRMPHWKKNNYQACMEGTHGVLTPPELSPTHGEPVFFKQFFNAFHQADLASTLQSLDVTTVIVAGLYLHACVRSAALESYERGYEVWVADDAVGTTEPLHAELSRLWLAQRAATFFSVDEIKKQLDPATSSYPQASDKKSIPMANINHHWLSANQDSQFYVHKNPSDAQNLRAIVPVADSDMVLKAADAVRQPLLLSCLERVSLLQRWIAELEKRRNSLVQLLVEDIGKPIKDAQEEFKRTLAHINHTLSLAADAMTPLRHRPIGCCAIITPWNNPLSTPISKIAPALFFGNTVLWKPAPQAPHISMAIMDSLIAAGVPEGAVSLLFGDETTARKLILNPVVGTVSITGSIDTGKHVGALCSMLQKPLQAELGGNNACIILADVDLEAVVADLALAAYSFAGQRCTSIRRFIVEQSIAGAFEALFAQAIKALAIGEPIAPNTNLGPVISESHLLKIQHCISDALAQGARLVCGGHRPAQFAKGYWLEPTLLTDVREDSAIVQEETFGPVAIIQTAIDMVDAVRLANSVPHGLLASLLTNDDHAKAYFSEHVEAGILKLLPGPLKVQPELPFGGWKASGYGPPEHGEWDRVFYTRPQTVYS